jgi:hypothetical protein
MYYFNSQLLTRWFHLTIKVFHLQIGYVQLLYVTYVTPIEEKSMYYG